MLNKPLSNMELFHEQYIQAYERARSNLVAELFFTGSADNDLYQREYEAYRNLIRFENRYGDHLEKIVCGGIYGNGKKLYDRLQWDMYGKA